MSRYITVIFATIPVSLFQKDQSLLYVEKQHLTQITLHYIKWPEIHCCFFSSKTVKKKYQIRQDSCLLEIGSQRLSKHLPSFSFFYINLIAWSRFLEKENKKTKWVQTKQNYLVLKHADNLTISFQDFFKCTLNCTLNQAVLQVFSHNVFLNQLFFPILSLKVDY